MLRGFAPSASTCHRSQLLSNPRVHSRPPLPGLGNANDMKHHEERHCECRNQTQWQHCHEPSPDFVGAHPPSRRPHCNCRPQIKYPQDLPQDKTAPPPEVRKLERCQRCGCSDGDVAPARGQRENPRQEPNRIKRQECESLDPCFTEESPATETLGKVGVPTTTAMSTPRRPKTDAELCRLTQVAPKARSVPPSGPPSTGCPQCSAASVRRRRRSRARPLPRSPSAWAR